MGSVKSLEVLKQASREKLGKGIFAFSDDYSVFDWGKMPDMIPGKGESLCTMGAFNFELLEKQGINTHYLGLTKEAKKLSELDSASNEMSVKLTTVNELPFSQGKYLYDDYFKNAGKNYLIPLEIIFRNTLPIGSSVRKRFTPSQLGFDFEEWPNENIVLKKPIYDFSTKLEEYDRYLSDDDSKIVSGLNNEKFDELQKIAKKVNETISKQAKKTGFAHDDGKIEMFYFNDEIYVCDVLGTFDENRFSFNGAQISKELARQYYFGAQFAWADDIQKAKQISKEKKLKEWKQFCKSSPDNLSKEFLDLFSESYTSGANQYTGKKWFDSRALKDVIKELQEKNFA